MKGFKDKSGKFRPTGNKTKSALKKSDLSRKSVTRKKQEMGNEVSRSTVHYHKGLMTNELVDLEEIREDRNQDRDYLRTQEQAVDNLTNKMSQLLLDVGRGHNDDISIAEINVARGEMTNLLNNWEEVRENRKDAIDNINASNRKLDQSVLEISNLLLLMKFGNGSE